MAISGTRQRPRGRIAIRSDIYRHAPLRSDSRSQLRSYLTCVSHSKPSWHAHGQTKGKSAIHKKTCRTHGIPCLSCQFHVVLAILACKACLTWPCPVSGRSYSLQFYSALWGFAAVHLHSFEAGRGARLCTAAVMRLKRWPALRAAAAPKVKTQALRGRAQWFTLPHCCACSALTQELAVLAQGACYAIKDCSAIRLRH